ncbi:MAG: MATE family efflux transporter [Clostridia bacterium]|nr:MATE family efflux transporter [Clostridia bacterium]
MKDLTVGRPGRVLLGYTLPLFGSIIFQQLYNIADSFVAGRYIGTDALAAVGNSYEVTLIYIALAFGCNIGTSVVTARYYGERKLSELRTCITTALSFSAILGIVLSMIGWIFSGPILQLMQTPPEVMADSRSYLDVYLLGYVFLLMYQVSTGVFAALGDSQTPFWFLAFSSVANIVVDILFVRDFGMGVPGVAWATFLCQSISGVAAVTAVLFKLRKLGDHGAPLFSARILGRILRIAAPSALQQSFISIGNILIQIVINGFGTACMAGYAAAVKLNNMCITSVTALGNGVSNYTSQNLGAGKKERIASGTKSGVMIGVVIALAFTAVYCSLSEQLLGLFIEADTEAIRIGVSFLRMITPFYAVIAVKLAMDGVLRGASQMGAFMTDTMTDLVVRVALAFALAPVFGIAGVWSAWPIGWCVGAALCVFFTLRWYRRLKTA